MVARKNATAAASAMYQPHASRRLTGSAPRAGAQRDQIGRVVARRVAGASGRQRARRARGRRHPCGRGVAGASAAGASAAGALAGAAIDCSAIDAEAMPAGRRRRRPHRLQDAGIVRQRVRRRRVLRAHRHRHRGRHRRPERTRLRRRAPALAPAVELDHRKLRIERLHHRACARWGARRAGRRRVGLDPAPCVAGAASVPRGVRSCGDRQRGEHFAPARRAIHSIGGWPLDLLGSKGWNPARLQFAALHRVFARTSARTALMHEELRRAELMPRQTRGS